MKPESSTDPTTASIAIDLRAVEQTLGSLFADNGPLAGKQMAFVVALMAMGLHRLLSLAAGEEIDPEKEKTYIEQIIQFAHILTQTPTEAEEAN